MRAVEVTLEGFYWYRDKRGWRITEAVRNFRDPTRMDFLVCGRDDDFSAAEMADCELWGPLFPPEAQTFGYATGDNE